MGPVRTTDPEVGTETGTETQTETETVTETEAGTVAETGTVADSRAEPGGQTPASRSRGPSLGGLKVLITRERDQAASTARRVEELGGVAIVFPAIEVVPPEDVGSLDAALLAMDSFDWVVCSSGNAVRVVTARLHALGSVAASRPRWAAVGPVTAAAVRQVFGAAEVLVPAREDADGLLQAMIEAGAAGSKVLVLRAEGGRDVVSRGLQEAGAQVREVIAYRTVQRSVPDREVRALLEGPRPDAALFLSPSAFRAFLSILGEPKTREFLQRAALCAIGSTTARAMRDAGFPPDLVPERPSLDEVLRRLSENRQLPLTTDHR